MRPACIQIQAKIKRVLAVFLDLAPIKIRWRFNRCRIEEDHPTTSDARTSERLSWIREIKANRDNKSLLNSKLLLIQNVFGLQHGSCVYDHEARIWISSPTCDFRSKVYRLSLCQITVAKRGIAISTSILLLILMN